VNGCLEISMTVVGLTPFQPAGHRVPFQGNGAAEGRNGAQGLSAGQRLLPLCQQTAVVTIAVQREPGDPDGYGQTDQKDGQEEWSFHGLPGNANTVTSSRFRRIGV
jgi:hypothetical protein